MDALCAYTARIHHLIRNQHSSVVSLTTEVIQDLRADCLSVDFVYAYLNTLLHACHCDEMCSIRVSMFDKRVGEYSVCATEYI